MSGMSDMLGSSSNDDEEEEANAAESQSKTLVFHSYSNRGMTDPDPYKQLDDWEKLTDEEIDLAYEISSGGGFVRTTLDDDLRGYEGREEWYNHFQIALAHYLSDIKGHETFSSQNVESEGAVPLMEDIFGFEARHFMSFFEENPEVVNQLDSERLAELAQQAEESEDE